MYSRLGNHGFEVCFIPQLTSVGIFLWGHVYSKNTYGCYILHVDAGTLASNCKGRWQSYFNFFFGKAKSAKNI